MKRTEEQQWNYEQFFVSLDYVVALEGWLTDEQRGRVLAKLNELEDLLERSRLTDELERDSE